MNLDEIKKEADKDLSIDKTKDSVCIEQNKTHYDIQSKQTNIITGLEKDVTTLTTQNNNLKKGVKWLGGGFLGTLVALLTLSFVK